MVKEEVVDVKPLPLKLEDELILNDHEDIGKMFISTGAATPHQVDNQSYRNEFQENVNLEKAPRNKLCLFPIVVVEKLKLSTLNSFLSTPKISSRDNCSAPVPSPGIKQELVDINHFRSDFVMKTGQPSLTRASSHSLSYGNSESSPFGAKRKFHRLVKMGSGTTKEIVESQIGINSSVNQNGESSWHDECASNISPALTAKVPIKEDPIIHNLVGALIKLETPANKDPGKSNPKKGYIPCDLCGAQLKNKGNLQGHLRNIHSNERPFLCNLCPYATKTKSCLTAHLLTHSNERPYKCELCGASFRNKGSILAHFLSGVHSNERPHACKLCPLRFAAKYNLKTHIKTHSNEKSYSCEVCGRGFITKRYLGDHLRKHSDEKPYACGRCHLKFRCKKSLRTHERLLSHQGSNLFNHNSVFFKKKGFRKTSLSCGSDGKLISCSNCSAQFKDITDFRCHLKIHSTERPYCCEICSATFKTRIHLQTHVQEHSEEKPFHCAHCSAKFNRRDVLRTHLATHSNEKPFSCDHCSKRFKIKSALFKHCKTH